MTCIVGLSDRGRVYMGGDSAGVDRWDLTVRADPKVFQVGRVLMGFTTSFRMGQLLRYKLAVPQQEPECDDHRWLSTAFVDAVRQCLKDGGYATKDKEVEAGGTFLVGYRGRVYVVDYDYQVGQPMTGFAAVGCGAPVALGALYATESLEPASRVQKALEAAEQFSAGVRGPFVFATLAGDEE